MSRNDYSAIIALGISMTVVTMGIGFIAPMLAVYADALGADGLWIGLIFGADPLFRALVLPYIGYLSDLRGRKGFLLVGLAGQAAVAVIMGLASCPWQLLLARMLQGCLSALVMPVARAYVGELAPRGREGSVMGSFNLSFMLGFSLGPLAGGVIVDLWGLRAPFVLMAGLSLLALVVCWLLVPVDAGRGHAVRPKFQQALRAPVVRGLALGRAFNSLGLGLFISLLPLFALTELSLSGTAVGLAIFSYTIFASCLQPVFGVLADRVNRKWIAAWGYVLTPIALLLLPQVTGLPSLLALSLFIGLGPGVFIPASLAIAVAEGKRYGMGSIMGLIEMAMSLGMAVGSVVGGAATSVLGISWAFRVVAILMLPGLPLFLTYLRGYPGPLSPGGDDR